MWHARKRGYMLIGLWWKTFTDGGYLEKPSVDGVITLKQIKIYNARTWAGLICLRTGEIGGLF
jgi:hypothetical protein